VSAVLRPNPPIPSDAELALLESDAIAAAWGGDVIALANADPNEVDAVGRRAIWRHGCDAGMIAPPTNVATPSDSHSAEALIAALRQEASFWEAEGPTAEKLLAAADALAARDAEVAELTQKVAFYENLWREAEGSVDGLYGTLHRERQKSMAEVAELKEAVERADQWRVIYSRTVANDREFLEQVAAAFGIRTDEVTAAFLQRASEGRVEVAELKAKIAAAVARLNAASIPPMMTEAQFNATTITDARRILLGSASSPVEGGN